MNGCLDLRYRAFPLDGQASVERNRCPWDGVLEIVWPIATTLSRLDACEDKKGVRRFRSQVSSHSS